MNIKRILANAIARRVAYVLVAAVIAWLGFGGTAEAQGLSIRCVEGTYPYSNRPCDQGEAHADVNAYVQALLSSMPQQYASLVRIDHAPASQRYDAWCRSAVEWQTWDIGCGSSWYRPDSGCSTRGPMTSGTAKHSGVGDLSTCDSGCRMMPVPGNDMGVSLDGGVSYFYQTKGWVATGDVCQSSDVGSGGECVPEGNLTQCMKPDGRHCAKASNGKEFCWGATEAGVKSSGNEAGTKAPSGTNINAPPAPPANGGDWTQAGQAGVQTKNGSTINSYSTTIFNSSYGTEGGGGGADGEGNGNGNGNGSGDGEGDGEGSASGGGDCEARPIVSDPMLEMVANQAWATRCAVEAGNAADVTGDIGDCNSTFSVQGDNANAHKLRAMRAQICGTSDGSEFGSMDSDIEGMLNEFDSPFSESDDGEFSSSRFGGGGGCPVVNIEIPGYGTFTLPPEACSVIAALRMLFLAVAAIWAFNIVRG